MHAINMAFNQSYIETKWHWQMKQNVNTECLGDQIHAKDKAYMLDCTIDG